MKDLIINKLANDLPKFAREYFSATNCSLFLLNVDNLDNFFKAKRLSDVSIQVDTSAYDSFVDYLSKSQIKITPELMFLIQADEKMGLFEIKNPKDIYDRCNNLLHYYSNGCRDLSNGDATSIVATGKIADSISTAIIKDNNNDKKWLYYSQEYLQQGLVSSQAIDFFDKDRTILSFSDVLEDVCMNTYSYNISLEKIYNKLGGKSLFIEFESNGNFSHYFGCLVSIFELKRDTFIIGNQSGKIYSPKNQMVLMFNLLTYDRKLNAYKFETFYEINERTNNIVRSIDDIKSVQEMKQRCQHFGEHKKAIMYVANALDYYCSESKEKSNEEVRYREIQSNHKANNDNDNSTYNLITYGYIDKDNLSKVKYYYGTEVDKPLTEMPHQYSACDVVGHYHNYWVGSRKDGTRHLETRFVEGYHKEGNIDKLYPNAERKVKVVKVK